MEASSLSSSRDLAAVLTALEFARAVERCAGTMPHDEPEITGETAELSAQLSEGSRGRVDPLGRDRRLVGLRCRANRTGHVRGSLYPAARENRYP